MYEMCAHLCAALFYLMLMVLCGWYGLYWLFRCYRNSICDRTGTAPAGASNASRNLLIRMKESFFLSGNRQPCCALHSYALELSLLLLVSGLPLFFLCHLILLGLTNMNYAFFLK